MKIEITWLALALFWYVPVVLDLDTGNAYNPHYDGEKIAQLKHKRLLPRYSKAPIYQEYLQTIHNRFGFPLGEWFYQYPKFELIPDHMPENVEDFFDIAHWLCESFDPSRYDPSFPDFATYLDDCTLQFAKDWCKKEGYEWYDARQKKENSQ